MSGAGRRGGTTHLARLKEYYILYVYIDIRDDVSGDLRDEA